MKTTCFDRILFSFAGVIVIAAAAFAQTTAFNYQVRLSESGMPVTGSRFFQFTVFDENGAAIPGAAVDQTLTVTNGVFNTSLDFGAGVFSGPHRYLEIAVKTNARDDFTNLNPRQTIVSAPCSIKALSLANSINSVPLAGVDSTRFARQDAAGSITVGGHGPPTTGGPLLSFKSRFLA